MAEQCNDPEVGTMLHAFELGALSEGDREAFEIHLLHCDYCLSQIREFEDQATILRADAGVRELVREDTNGKRSLWAQLKTLLWPEAPLVLRPALHLALLFALMAYPAYLGLQQLTGSSASVKSVPVIRLSQTRSVFNATFHLDSGEDGVISITYLDAIENKEYIVSVTDSSGHELVSGENIIRFDYTGRAELLVSVNRMSAGDYKLVILDPETTPPTSVAEYVFRVKR